MVIALLALSSTLAAQAAESIARIPETKMREIVELAAKDVNGDVALFRKSVVAQVRTWSPGWDFSIGVPLVPIAQLNELTAGATGPMSSFYLSASDLVRKMDPVGAATWTDGVTILISPSMINAPNIEKVVVQRDGKTVEPTSGALTPTVLTTRMGAKTTLNSGRLIYPVAAFDAGASVRILLIPTVGANIVTELKQSDLLKLR